MISPVSSKEVQKSTHALSKLDIVFQLFRTVFYLLTKFIALIESFWNYVFHL